MLTGGCFCGYVRYEVHAESGKQTNCHCSICRRTSGAPFVAWFTVPERDYRLVSGQPQRFASSSDGERGFCPRCGTPLTFQSRQYADEIDVTTCSLDDPERVPPRDHTFARSKLSWVKLDDGLPEFSTTRG
jgi:hypothetical protein